MQLENAQFSLSNVSKIDIRMYKLTKNLSSQTGIWHVLLRSRFPKKYGLSKVVPVFSSGTWQEAETKTCMELSIIHN